ncbi:MAG: lipopolysaccharide transport periplasmic protein LptA [Usitatibacter sp.]
MRPTALLMIATVLAAASAPSSAERADREKEIVVGADHLLADDANRTSTFEGAVVVTQGTMRIGADKVTVKEDAERHKYYIANGAPVSFRQKRDNVDEWIEGFADRAEFDDRADVLKLFNRARVKSNQSEITGDFITYDMRKEVAEVSGAPPGRTAPPKEGTGRVKVIIQPPKKTAADDDKAGKGASALKLKSDAGGQ